MSTKKTPTNGPARAMSDAELLRMQEADGRLRRYPQGEHAPALSSMLADTEALEGVAEWLKQQELTVNVGAAIEPDEDVHIESSAGWLLRLVRTALTKQGTPDLTGARIAEQHIDRIRELEAEVAKLRAPVADERAAFEVDWRGSSDLAKDPLTGAFTHPDTQKRWAGWLSRAALASAPVAGETVADMKARTIDALRPFVDGFAGVRGHAEAAALLRDLETVPAASAAPQPNADFRIAYMEWQEKTDFIQKRIASGELPVKYLGWHRADVMRDLIEQAQAGAPLASMARAIFGDRIGGQMDAMAGDTSDGDTDGARYEALEREHLGDADKGTGIYHPDNHRAGDGLAAKRARIEADMARGSRLTSHRLRLDEQHPVERPPADIATMLLWLKRRMTWDMVHIPGREVVRLVGEIEALQRSQRAAARTLSGLGYTDHGGELWKPPLGARPAWLDAPASQAAADIDARARQLVADAAASGQVVRIDLVPRQPLAMGNLEMVVDVRPARHAPAPD